MLVGILLNTYRPTVGGFSARHVSEVKPKQLSKAPSPRLVTELGMVTDVMLAQAPNAQPPIVVTEFGMSTDVKLLLQKANSPMVVTELGIVIEVKSLP